MSKYKTVIFDFDGTIADTFKLVVQIINQHAKDFGIDGIDRFEVEKFRDMSVKYILSEFKLNILHLPKYISFVKRELAKRMPEVKAFEDMDKVFDALKADNIQLGIVTSNYVKTVTDLLTDEQEKQFDFIKSSRAIFGKHAVLNKLINEYGLDKAATLYIGDEIRDIEAAKKTGIAVCSVTWGYNSEKILKEHNPDYLIHRPLQILDITLQ